MEEKQMSKYGIILDGRMDEPVWDTVEGMTGFQKIKKQGGDKAPENEETIFKILSCEDRIYVGFKCLEPDVQQVITSHPNRPIWMSDRVELFLITNETNFDFYQFVVTFSGTMVSNYYIEGGNTQPDPYAPDWKSAVYVGDDYWSVEMEIPLTAFYMTSSDRWRKDWRANVIRCRSYDAKSVDVIQTCWAECDRTFWDFEKFKPIYNLPTRPACDELRINSASVNLEKETETGYFGTMTVTTTNPEDATFEFFSENADTITLDLEQGYNEFTVPCHFEKLGRFQIPLGLKRLRDGKEFKRRYRQIVAYEPVVMRFTLPEYRCNFYPGQDYSKIVGQVTTSKPVTLKLEGPGIETQIVTPDAEGNFAFDTPNFEIGDAFITATVDGYEKVQKIRRLAPTGHTMAWISGGNLIVDGEPLLARWMYAAGYRGGEALRRKYNADNLHETRQVEISTSIHPVDHLPACGLPIAEQREDKVPSKALLDRLEKVIEYNKDKDFVYYYIADEPECCMYSPIYYKHLYEFIADKDPYHVIMLASRHPRGWVNCADWFQVHPYICPEYKDDGTRIHFRHIRLMGSFVDSIAKLNRPDKCVGFLPTSFTGGGLYSDYPTLDEYICHTWAAMIHGGKTLWPYAYHDMNDRASMYEGNRYLFSSFEALETIVLLGKRTVLTRTDEYEGVLYEHEDEKMFVLVNFNQYPVTVTLDGISGTWHEFRHDRTITGNTFEMKPLEVIIGTNTVKDAGIPTYQETAALIDKLEYERTHTGSLLLDRWKEIGFTSSARRYGTKFKLFDGIWDDYACTIVGGEDEPNNYAEVDLTKVKPTFKKVKVGGWHLEDMQVKVRIGDELITPEVVEEQVEEFSKTVLLKEAVTPDALRLEFMGKEVELYEIAVF